MMKMNKNVSSSIQEKKTMTTTLLRTTCFFPLLSNVLYALRKATYSFFMFSTSYDVFYHTIVNNTLHFIHGYSRSQQI